MSLNLGIDVGGTKVLGGVVDQDGKVLVRCRKETPREGGESLVQTIADVASELMAQHQIGAIGICAAGFISSDRKTVTATPNIAGWNGLNLADALERLLKRPVIVENDAKSAAWGEKRFGAGRDFDTLFMLTIGTGLGGGFINKGELFRGAHGIATEFGHMRAVPNGHLCGCGARGCYEQYAAGSALLRHAREAIDLKRFHRDAAHFRHPGNVPVDVVRPDIPAYRQAHEMRAVHHLGLVPRRRAQPRLHQ